MARSREVARSVEMDFHLVCNNYINTKINKIQIKKSIMFGEYA